MQVCLQPLENPDVQMYCIVGRRVNHIQYKLKTAPGVGGHDIVLPTFILKHVVNRTKPTVLF